MRDSYSLPTFGSSLPDRGGEYAPEWNELRLRRVVIDDLMNDVDFRELMLFLGRLRVHHRIEVGDVGW